MWAVEKDPALRSDFCNLTILDDCPDDDRLRVTLERALSAIPRLRQRVVGAPVPLMPPEFADDPALDLSAHMRVVAVPSPGDDRALLELCGALAEQPLDRTRPLFEFIVIVGLAGGRAALLQKLHHTITDGVGAMRLSLALVDAERHPPAPSPASEPTDLRAPEEVAAEGAATTLTARRAALVDATTRGIGAVRAGIGTAGHIVTHPAEVPGRAGDAARLAASLQRQLLVTETARSDEIGGRSLRRRFATHTVPLATLRKLASHLGGSVNDAFVTGLASAMGRYHERLGSTVDELRVAIPISTRGRADTASNRVVPTRVLIPIQPAHDIAALFSAVHARLADTKQESAVGAAEGLFGLVAGLPSPVLVALTRAQARTIDFAASNLRGSRIPLYLAGTRIIASFPFGPRIGSALNVTMMSYCDDVHLGFNIDPAAIVDAQTFMDDVADAYRAFETWI